METNSVVETLIMHIMAQEVKLRDRGVDSHDIGRMLNNIGENAERRGVLDKAFIMDKFLTYRSAYILDHTPNLINKAEQLRQLYEDLPGMEKELELAVKKLAENLVNCK